MTTGRSGFLALEDAETTGQREASRKIEQRRAE
jgi:hypothetical protein